MFAGFFVQEVPHSQLHPFVVVSHPYLGHRIHHNIDEIVGWDVLIGLDVHCNLSKVQFIQLFKKRDFDARPPMSPLGCLRRPDMMYAWSGGALTYPWVMMMMTRMTGQ